MSMSGERGEMESFSGRLLRWAGAYTILFVGGSHLLIAGEHFLAATYLGVLFLANFAGSVVAALGMYLSPGRWGWLLGALISGGAFAGFLASRTLGLPGFEHAVGQWFSIPGLSTLALEGLFLSLAVLAVAPQGRAFVEEVDRREIGQDKAHEEDGSPESPEDIEREMDGIRARTSPDLADLRKHVEPQVVREQAKQSALQYLQGVRDALGSNPGSRRPESFAAVVFAAAVAVLVLRRTSGGSD